MVWLLTQQSLYAFAQSFAQPLNGILDASWFMRRFKTVRLRRRRGFSKADAVVADPQFSKSCDQCRRKEKASHKAAELAGYRSFFKAIRRSGECAADRKSRSTAALAIVVSGMEFGSI